MNLKDKIDEEEKADKIIIGREGSWFPNPLSTNFVSAFDQKPNISSDFDLMIIIES